MATASILLPGCVDADAQNVPARIAVSDAGGGLVALQLAAELTVSPTNLATSAKQDTLQTAIGSISDVA